ncbi:Tsga10 [Phodopus roborovskii]|uniref:Tsga10 protein n=1 Tax=Phodopus roborovskii TaxID=109678 RepID=A0AAV0A5X5_PHORO|nr:Tsga10 [Phodopus roborovskii]
MIRNRSKSPRRPSPSSRGANCDVELLKSTTRDREELKCMLEKYERHLAEIQGNVKVLTSERDKTFILYEQAQEEIARLRREMMKSCKSPKSTTAHAILRRVETERDVAFTDLRRMTTERDSLRERLKIAQETAFNEKAHLEQRIEELECTVHNLDDERMEQMSNMTLMKETITTVEKEMKSLARKAMDTESELGRQKAENNSLRQSTEALIMCEQDISRMRRQLDETNDELAQIARERDILAHENDTLQEQFSKAKQENQALSKKLNDTHNELNDIKQKVQDTNLEVNKLKNILKSEESENRQIMEQLRKANEDAENWENKARQSEADNNTLKLELITAEAEGNRLKEKVDALNREVEQMENELDSARSEIELLRSQMTNERISMQNLEALLVANRDKEYQSQIALQEKESEIQLLKEHLCLAENKMAIQSRDVAQFRNVVTQLEADLDITKRQLGTERFERERAVQELRRQNYSSNAYHLSSVKPNTKCHSPERAHHRSPDRGLDRSLEE